MPDLPALEKRAYDALMAREAKYAREVQLVLRETLDEMRLQMGKLYERYSVNGVLIHAEMSKYNRLATAEKQLLQAVDPAVRKTLRVINRLGPEQYEAAFYHYAWAMDNAAGVRLGWGVLNKATIMENLASEFSKISTTRYGDGAQLAVRSALNQGLAQGKGYAVMARDLKKAINATYGQALRIIRTEGQTAVNAGQEDSYVWAQHKGIDLDMKWDATLDDRTRPDHQAADGQTRDPETGLFTIGGEKAAYPGDPALSAAQRIHCRCRIRAEIEGYSPQIRRSREDGVIPYQTFSEWDKGREHFSPAKSKVAGATVPRLPRAMRPSAPEPGLPSFVEHKPGTVQGPRGFGLPNP